jgi:stearoyl-CoA desaturase (Delta-9 desaturase)
VPPLGLVAAVWLLWDRGVRPVDLVLLAAFYAACGLGITVGFHRLLTHKSFDERAPPCLVGDLGSMATQGRSTQWVTAASRGTTGITHSRPRQSAASSLAGSTSRRS